MYVYRSLRFPVSPLILFLFGIFSLGPAAPFAGFFMLFSSFLAAMNLTFSRAPESFWTSFFDYPLSWRCYSPVDSAEVARLNLTDNILLFLDLEFCSFPLLVLDVGSGLASPPLAVVWPDCLPSHSLRKNLTDGDCLSPTYTLQRTGIFP